MSIPMLGIAVDFHRQGYEITFLATGTSGRRWSSVACEFSSNWAAGNLPLRKRTTRILKMHPMPSATFFRGPSCRSYKANTPKLKSDQSNDTVVIASCLGFGAQFAHEEDLGVPAGDGSSPACGYPEPYRTSRPFLGVGSAHAGLRAFCLVWRNAS